MYKDNGLTNKLEVSVFKNTQMDQGEGEIVHSKAQSGQFIDADYPTFLALVKNAIEE
eukprot:CAMPEP_0176343424 /NCGR_PEP_ID=MMETSP0126-20121128/3931_1 /TAXON_ID=141414 ORGANISM="Strombidinopsis acuminatum, Strain SPMC142" /NCGR_SAMPLE_ID=MMETSP0126 /ASSEMBLY_ACC=CAM_ASM_000229 /LENGTH=56 /DNA_ID=CAMNT_0017689361 /DNA_START=182 /DNA_END=352 /DNA_ORIENTATION=-